jgi:signal transduction histidine kinase
MEVGAPAWAPQAFLWMAAFAAVIFVFSSPALSPRVPHTVVRLVSVPLAALGFALMLRPRGEHPVYCLIYFVTTVWRELESPHIEFTVVRSAIEVAEMAVLVGILYRFFYHRFAEPLMLGAWAIAVLGVTAITASLMTIAAKSFSLDSPDSLFLFGGSMAAAWRYWWLGNACNFLAIAGPAATLVNLRHRLHRLLLTSGPDRRAFIGLTAALLVTTLFSFPVFDMSWRAFPPDVILSLRLLPVPFVMAMAARFRANGAAVATMIFTVISVVSITGPAARQNWANMPLTATPTHTLLLVTTIACMVLAAISRQLQSAVNDALKAGEVKSRFIGLMSHELRTPLNAILGFSELMKMQSLYELGEQVATLDNIHASGQRLLAMIDALLSHAGEGETIFELRKEPLHLHTAVTGALHELEELANSSGCTVDLDIPTEMFVEADARALRQVLHVLFGHALRLCEDNGVTKISARHAQTDTILEIRSDMLRNEASDELDRVESQLVNALVLAHGARLTVRKSPHGRTARVRFFATRAANGGAG